MQQIAQALYNGTLALEDAVQELQEEGALWETVRAWMQAAGYSTGIDDEHDEEDCLRACVTGRIRGGSCDWNVVNWRSNK